MVPGLHAEKNPNKIAYIMADYDRAVTYGELEADANRIAHLFRNLGYRPGDGIALFSENNEWYLKICWAAHRAGLYYTCISSYLTASEVDYIVGDCQARGFITSSAMSSVAAELRVMMEGVEHRFTVDGDMADYLPLQELIAEMPADMIDDPVEGSDMLYSSGTTGRPKGIRTVLSAEPYGHTPDGLTLITDLYRGNSDSVYLSPAPLYHAAPLRFNMAMLRIGATNVIMSRFDAELALKYIEKYRCSHSQWVPSMFVRLLKLPTELRNQFDLSSMRVAIHAAAPCPIPVKQSMIDWWGPIIYEYYAGTEGNGFTSITSEQWLQKPGSVGTAIRGVLHIEDADGKELGPGEEGVIYFSDSDSFEYHNDPEKTAASRNAKGWSTLGDIGYLDDDGYLFLTDRKAHMIISGGVNIYPQEVENLLVSHPDVLDAAVIGVPSEEFGEEVKAVVQPVSVLFDEMEMGEALLRYCRANLSKFKCPKSIDFVTKLPRHDNGKLFKRILKEKYWEDRKSLIV